MDYKSDLHSDDDFDCSNGYSENYGSNSNNGAGSGYISNGQGRQSNPNGLSKAELRKTNKPIMEKRRRARINHCLNVLKTLILEAMKKDPARHTKLEKADILEMTVKHLQSLQRQQLNMAIQTDPSVIHKFRTGFVECAEEVNRYISQLDGIDAATRQRLNNHLNNCATSLDHIGSMTNFNNSFRNGQMAAGGIGNVANSNTANLLATNLTNTFVSATSTSTSTTIFPNLPQDLNNNSRGVTAVNASPLPAGSIQMNGVQLIPSRLPSGELALIVPNAHAANAATNLLNTNNVNNFQTWPGSNQPPGTTPLTGGPVPPMSLLDNGNVLPTINNFAAQLQRMSAFSKPILTPQTVATQQAQTALTTALIKPSNAINSTKLPCLIPITTTVVAAKPNFHTTTAAAFHQPLIQHTTTATSPPLSPISSVSSLSAGHGEDSSSLIQTSNDLINARPGTPPQQHDITTAGNGAMSNSQQNSFAGVFTSPPLSAESSSLYTSSSSGVSSLSSSSLSLGSKHLQQQQVTSTSGSESLNVAAAMPKQSLKRSLEDADSSDGSLGEPASKRCSASSPINVAEEESLVIRTQSANDSQKQKLQMLDDERDSMWRPW